MKMFECMLIKNDCYKAGRTIKPKGVMVHSTGANNPNIRRYVQPVWGQEDYRELMNLLGKNTYGNHWNRSGVDKCVHAFIGLLADGTVATVQTLPWSMRGWHCGAVANNTHISFEMCEDNLTDPDYFADVYREAVELTAYLCKQYGLDPLADGVVICHAEGYRRGIASGHSDVEPWFSKQGKTMDDFRQDVDRMMKGDDDMDVKRFRELYLEMRKEDQDNDAGTWSQEAREWALQNGIVQGNGTDINGQPNGMWEDVMTREQFATVLYRFFKWFAGWLEKTFSLNKR